MNENGLLPPRKPQYDPLAGSDPDPPARFLTADEQALLIAPEWERREAYEAGKEQSVFG